MISVKVMDTASPRLRRILAQAKNPRQILLAAGRAVANLLRKHYTERNAANPNKLGGKRTNFWLQIKRGVQAPVAKGANAVVVSITHPAIAQKVKGGTITPKRRKFLTIPVRPEAYGRTAATFTAETGSALKLVFGKGGPWALASEDGLIQYILRRKVTQRPDPEALPPPDRMRDAALGAAALALRVQLSRA
jgi:hypothetical protein